MTRNSCSNFRPRRAVRSFLQMLSHIESVEAAMMDNLTQKGTIIEQLLRESLPADEAHFTFDPGKPLAQPIRSS